MKTAAGSGVVVCCQQLSNVVAALPAVIATALEMVVVAHKSSGRILKSVSGSDSDQKQKQKQQDRENLFFIDATNRWHQQQ